MKQEFCSKQDNKDLKELFNSQIENILVLINANDKNYNQRFDNVVEATKSALSAADRAVSKAEVATEKRFESVNEFRQTLSDQAAKFIVRTEFELVVDRLEQDIKNLALARSELVTMSSYITAHKGLQDQVDELRLSRANIEGKASQTSVDQIGNRTQISLLFGLIGTIIGIITLLLRFT